MELPPPHVLAQLDAIIIGQESIVAINGDLQNADEAPPRQARRNAIDTRAPPAPSGQLREGLDP